MIRLVCWFTCVLLLAPLSLWSAPLTARLQSVMTTAIEPVAVIVRLKSMDARARVQGLSRKSARRTLVGDLKQQARQSQAALIGFLRQQGVTDPQSLWLINGLAFSASPALIAQLQSWPGVELISVDQTVPRPVVMSAAAASVEWNINMIGAPQLWAQGFDGTGVVVASLDTGVDVNHPDLSGNWRGGSNSWFDPYSSSTLPYDPFNPDPRSEGHGTAVMGVLVGGNASGSSIGVAPGAQWIAAKIFPAPDDLDFAKGAKSAKIILALEWVLDPDSDPLTDDGADIINNSWGFDNLENQCLTGAELTDYQVALANLRLAGVAVVFSAGNTGPLPGSSIPPGNMSGILAVGAVDINRNVAYFSARGPSPCDTPGEVFPSLVAPGMSISSADLLSGYTIVDGTSFSAPQVAGALALLRDAFPTRSMANLEAALMQSAVDLGAQGDDDVYGSGLLDVAAAYNLLLPNTDPALVISDPTAPSTDGIIDFASVAPLDIRILSLILKNGGSNTLSNIFVDDSVLDPVFSISSDPCSGQPLVGGASCIVGLSFSPTALGSSYSSVLSIHSNDPRGTQGLQLNGFGNSPPPTPVLQLPVDGAIDVPRSFVFSWKRGADLDGDVVTDYLLITAHGDFSDSTPLIAAIPQAIFLFAGSGLLFGLFGPRRRQRWLMLLFFVLALVQVSCGGGGSASPASVQPTVEYPYNGNLQSGATYYWKVRSVDSRGGVTESAVWSFTTL